MRLNLPFEKYPAPSRLVLTIFGGELSIEQFRNITEKKYNGNILLPPLISIIPQLEVYKSNFSGNNDNSMTFNNKIDKFNIQSLSITIGKCASLSIVAKFDNNSDLQKFERFALGLLQQLRKTFTFKEGGFPGVTIFNYEGEASLERIKVN